MAYVESAELDAVDHLQRIFSNFFNHKRWGGECSLVLGVLHCQNSDVADLSSQPCDGWMGRLRGDVDMDL